MLGKLKGLLGGKSRVNIERRFSILNETPQGSMSRVYRAIDNENGRTVCLKVQIPDKHAAAMSRAISAERPSEGEIGEKIVHPNVVRTYEYGMTTEGAGYVVLEFIHGVSLKFVREATNLGLRGKVKLLAQAADGLAAVHAAGFIHHDINPNNFLVDRENQVKLIDFGLSVPNTPAFHRPGNRTGMLQYMAPELIRRESTNEKLDVFSFGVVAYELLTDKLPYGGGNNTMAQMTQKMNADAMDPALANPRLSEPLCEVLRRTLARRKEDRWGSMAKLAEVLREIPVKREASQENDPD